MNPSAGNGRLHATVKFNIYKIILCVGLIYSALYFSVAIDTWSAYREPVQYQGFGPFSMGSIEFLLMYAARCLSWFVLGASFTILFWKRDVGIRLATLSSLIAFLYFFSLIYKLYSWYEWNWIYNVPVFQIFDFTWTLIILGASVNLISDRANRKNGPE